MERLTKVAAVVITAALLAGCEGGSSVLTPAVSNVASRTLTTPLGPTSIVPGGGPSVALCTPSTDPMRASCLSTLRIMSQSTASAFSDSVNGLTPNDLASIYGYAAPASQASTPAVVGVVVAYDNANVESDLGVYRSHFGLSACTTANGCFKKIGASGTTAASFSTRAPYSVTANPTTTISGWAAEADADVEVVSAVCSQCKIVLSEAATSNLSDLANAVTAATNAGATIINASFGAPESSSQTSLESAFEPEHIKVVAAAGDNGPAELFPAAATNVVAVSGTTINVSGSTVSQSLWSNSGGGCSQVFARASFQPSWCANRSIADVAAVGDPSTGLAFYDSMSNVGGWAIVGGTSVSAPIITGMYAMSGDAANGTGAQNLYNHTSQFLQVSGAGNLDGLGTPTGLGSF